MFIPILWKIPILINIFSDGLKLETTKQLHPRRLRNRTWKWWELGRWFSSSRGPVFSGSSRWSSIVQMGWNHQAVTLLGTNISPQKGTFEDDFPYPKVGYVSSLEGKYFLGSWLPRQVRCFFFVEKLARIPGLDADTRTGGEYRCLHRVPKLGHVWVVECVVAHDGSMRLVSYIYLHEFRWVFMANVD